MSEDAIRARDAAAVARERCGRGAGRRLRARGDRGAGRRRPHSARRRGAGLQHRQRRVVPILMRIAILDPFSGIAGDMTLGALIQVGLDPDWLRALPATLGLADIGVDIREVIRGEIVCQKVDFRDSAAAARPTHHAKSASWSRRAARRSACASLPTRRSWRSRTAEGEIHGMPPEQVHLHEVGAVDAILDVVGVIWGLELLGVERVLLRRDRARRRNGEGGARHSSGSRAGDAQAARGTSGASGAGGIGRAGHADRRGARPHVVVRAAARRIHACAQRVRRRNEGLSRASERACASFSRTRMTRSQDRRWTLVELVCDIDDMSAGVSGRRGRSDSRRRRAGRRAPVDDDEARPAGDARGSAVSPAEDAAGSKTCCSSRRRRSACAGASVQPSCACRARSSSRPCSGSRSRPSSSRCRTAAVAQSPSSPTSARRTGDWAPLQDISTIGRHRRRNGTRTLSVGIRVVAPARFTRL